MAIEDPDEFYAALIAAHQGLSDEHSVALNCRLILLLADEIGDKRKLAKIIAAAVHDDRTDE